jgi:hypothetical protein
MTTNGESAPRPNLHFRLDAADVTAAKRRARREYRTLTDVVAAAVAAYGAGETGCTFPPPADPDE